MAWAIRGNSQRRQGQKAGRLLLCNFLPNGLWRNPLQEGSPVRPPVLQIRSRSLQFLHSEDGRGTPSWGAASGKYARAFEVTGYKSIITGASRGAGKSFLHKHGYSRREVKQQLRDVSLLPRGRRAPRNLSFHANQHVITAVCQGWSGSTFLQQ